MNKSYTHKRLTEVGLKVTQPRLAILKILVESKEHPTVDDVYSKIQKSHPGISLATVYKTLETFTDTSLIKKVGSRESSIRYDARQDSHSHLICIKSNKMLDFHDSELNLLIEEYIKKKNIDNFEVQNIEVNLYGELINQKY